MKFINNDCQIRADDEVKKDHRVEIDLDLMVDDFLKGKNLPYELTMNETQIRRQLFDIVLNRVLFKGVQKNGVPYGIKGKYKWKAHSEIENDWTITESKVPDESVKIKNRVKVVCDISVDRPVNAMQAVRAANHAIANVVSDNIIAALKNRFLSISSSDTTTKTQVKDGDLTTFEVKENGNKPGMN